MAASASPNDDAFPSAEVSEIISRLRPSDLAGDVLAAIADLGGEAKRSEIITRAVELGGWTDEQLAVRSHYSGAARTFHVRTCADYAVDLSRGRGHLVAGSAPARWRLASAPETTAPADVPPHPFGRVFTAGVGLGHDPVDDGWSATDQTHVWFKERSLRISRGHHVFTLAAGRHSAVVGRGHLVRYR